ncbi:YggS family pyridoxal phosphate-dependent enzyme [Streptomyces mutabilis]|jgi:pyridoxal phosphate enzyme (YggS family)|uniref:YggS family pyridoxal phosphate-dependent enzyme n=1 Tax=Streptomyces TaxID=1883 RepID=UPI000A23C0F3|nr:MULTISPECIES: YggS family pyridoxal phosphate-dependent enzyme [Streptomyces]MDG9691755.1 YggS family pyridoxal phosphate-dependent enzyme [Streptomyces sp. DH17]OSC70151.1 YggS family pyridoxal phosphate enzyme [Streptomyces sp. 4F]MCZ9350666.1 YggS family pyridoxal phosphate-dependent enzyme [Streptomyces mutabilis]MDN3246784.1 YggS family pyridoxal phosphate-dependent enzyme [Streptomyces sp. ZSW22]MDN3251927.1 YggS family pyridoxal phosphate-dependent enzyme [Streptomyces sp. MA25(2023)
MTDRKSELAGNLARVEERIAAACAAAGRRRDEVTLIVVTKTYPADDVRILSDLGVRHVAENRDQDAAPKAAACSDLPLSWHFVGQLQTNKVRSVVGYADVVQSVDRPKLVTALSKEAVRVGREVGCLIQVALDAGESARGERGGVSPAGIEELADLVAGAEGLRLDGLMTVAPLTGEYAGRQQAAFERLMDLSTYVRRTHPAANMVSAGMSADLEQAVAAGATHVRVGTAVLGVRPRLG